MKAKILKIQKKKSEYGGHFYFVFMKGEDGKSYKTCLYPSCGNFKRWSFVIEKHSPDKEMWLGNLRVKNGRLVDADSLVELVSKPKAEPEPEPTKEQGKPKSNEPTEEQGMLPI